jgi:hypothetical protein
MDLRLSALSGGRTLRYRKILVLISVRRWVNIRAFVRLEGLSKLKKKISSSTGIRTRDIPSFIIVPHQTSLLPASMKLFMNNQQESILLLLNLFLSRRVCPPWWWRRCIPPKHRILQEPHIPEDGILPSHRCEYLKSYIALTGWAL